MESEHKATVMYFKTYITFELNQYENISKAIFILPLVPYSYEINPLQHFGSRRYTL